MKKAALLSLILLYFSTTVVLSQQLAFPGAEGFGRFAQGGRGGDVYHVTTLENDGPGSLRYGIETASGPRTIMFDIAGNIELLSTLKIRSDKMTIAGQSAPGSGICIQGYGVSVSADDIIIRHIRVRPGDKFADPNNPAGFDGDAVNLQGNNIIADHLSASWAIDENLSSSKTSWNNLTFQSCIIAECLHKSVINPDDGHSMGSLIKIQGSDANATLLGNIYIHNDNRNPAIGGYDGTEYLQIDFRNNLLYNDRAFGYSTGMSHQIDLNYIGNYIISGSATHYAHTPIAFHAHESNHVHIFQAGNKIDRNRDGIFNGVNNGWGMFYDTWVAHELPFELPVEITYSADQTLEIALADAGAIPWQRDEVDVRLINHIKQGTGQVIDSQEQVGGYQSIDVITRPPDWDSDNDGMPDEFEILMGFNPEDSTDGNGDADNDGYTNLEAYLNSLCVHPEFIYPPAELTAHTVSGTQIDLGWKSVASNFTHFSIERSTEPTQGYAEIQTTELTHFSDTNLTPATNYFYRVRAISDVAPSNYSETISAWTLKPDGRPLESKDPLPVNEAQDVDERSWIHWKSGTGAAQHHVYFGTSPNPPFLTTTDATSLFPGYLSDSTTYYWRVDEVNSLGATEGPLWQFTTEWIESDLVGFWGMNKASLYLADDASGHLNWGLLRNIVNADWVEGIFGTAIFFDGIDNYFYVKDKFFFDFYIRGISVSFWLKTDEILAAPVLVKGLSDQTEPGKGFSITLDETNGLTFTVADSQTRASVTLPANEISLSEWNYLTAVRHEPTRELRWYLNGVPKSTAPDSTTDITSGDFIFVGTDSNRVNFFKGILDEIRLYNYTLPEAEIIDLYEKPSSVAQPEPQSFKLNLANYPNPFNYNTIISYSIPQSGKVTLKLFNLLGQEVLSLIDRTQPAGIYTCRLELPDLTSGVYFCILTSGNQKIARKILYLR
ncbi:T9SS type A sorting domain-containing protein [candidate division KSB1 bacterium]|nr:T9SS type A sorting domain-containing protein [candidate division KSB1 bacterium]